MNISLFMEILLVFVFTHKVAPMFVFHGQPTGDKCDRPLHYSCCTWPWGRNFLGQTPGSLWVMTTAPLCFSFYLACRGKHLSTCMLHWFHPAPADGPHPSLNTHSGTWDAGEILPCSCHSVGAHMHTLQAQMQRHVCRHARPRAHGEWARRRKQAEAYMVSTCKHKFIEVWRRRQTATNMNVQRRLMVS